MARDVKIIFNSETLTGDVFYEFGDLTREEGLITAVLISLYTDRRASSGDVIDNPEDKKGWWGDLVPDTGDRIGSKLWQYSRSKTTQDTLVKVKKILKECLQWMIDDGVAKKIEVTTERFGTVGNDKLGAIIKIYRRKEDESLTIKFDDLWEAEYAVSGG